MNKREDEHGISERQRVTDGMEECLQLNRQEGIEL
jgi:hypothetical protein